MTRLPRLLSVTTTLILAAAAVPLQARDRVILDIDFDDEPLDQPIGNAGPLFGQPVSNDAGWIREAPFERRHLELFDDSDCCSRYTRFEFKNGEELAAGTVQLTAQVYFPEPVSATIVAFREAGTSANSFLNFYTGTFTNNVGNGWLNAYAGNTYSGSLTQPGYPIDRWVPMRVAYSPDLRQVRLEMDGALIWMRSDFDLQTSRGVGAVLMGAMNNATTGSVMRVDDLRVVHCESTVFDDCLLVDHFGD